MSAEPSAETIATWLKQSPFIAFMNLELVSADA